ncbi:hypothetical protein B9G69_003520 [Bdellovibrio sp. SKB1291214]|uniref:hypothetical protein n=1 Tax=Bdellovibrio sp. SKB1291214 TaxID=1732569 RepID=UPI000B519F50|nr:hypothetical protein [Bdellovibrio sp. SKB1291214]UYL09641.1 hypothetical protein B9G69_003520 [Bdellovibrio sp. SKB1291214]
MEQPIEKRKLLIIKSHPQSLGPVEGFLKNRDWDIKSTHNLKEAMVFLVQNQPQFVMVSIDHPNKKVRNLPKVLSQAFPVCVIAFAENSTPTSVKVLNDCNAGYAIYHPITGPAVERMVNKYHKDQSQTNNAAAAQRTWDNAGGSNSGVIAIRGGEAGADGTTASSQNFLANLMGALEGNSTSGSFAGFGQGSLNESNIAVQPGMAGYIPPTSPDSNVNGPFMRDPYANPTGISDLGGARGSQSASDALDPNDPNYDPYGDGGSSAYSSRKKNDTMWAPVEETARTKNSKGLKETADEVAKDPGSLILKGTREAMDKACIITEKKRKIEIATNVACILVESGRFSGYLVAAMAQHLTIDVQFVEKIRTRLFKFLTENGENLSNNETMPIRIKQVPFAAWAVEHAEFLRKSVHEGNEVAMAFFPNAELKADIAPSPDEEMAAVKINDIRTDVPVEFNLYVHLPRNNRYVLYTPQGGVFLGEQKNRLVNQGVTQLHILRMELQNLDKYRAQNFLNDKIDEYEAQQENEAKDRKKSVAS